MKTYKNYPKRISKSDDSLSKVKANYKTIWQLNDEQEEGGWYNVPEKYYSDFLSFEDFDLYFKEKNSNDYTSFITRKININLKVLIACEESQTVATAFRNLGFEAYSCDIQECSGLNPSYHIQGDAISEAYSGKYDLMIAHPPCTFLSKAGARWMFPTAGNLSQSRYEKAMDAKEFFLRLLNAPIRHIAVENPFPLKVCELPKESQTIQPYEYGEPFSKKTLLWLKNLPQLTPTNVLTEYKPLVKSNTGGTKRGQMARPNNLTAKETSKTFQGIADAMAKQWGNYILNNLNP